MKNFSLIYKTFNGIYVNDRYPEERFENHCILIASESISMAKYELEKKLIKEARLQTAYDLEKILRTIKTIEEKI